mgnify:CR=1 FL=1
MQIGTSTGITYSDTGLTASTTYSYAVAAFDAAGNTSVQSNEASATTQSATVPPPSDSFAGADVYSSLRMPSGIAPAVILEPVNAALFAAKLFGQFDPAVNQAVLAFQKKQADKILEDDSEIQN